MNRRTFLAGVALSGLDLTGRLVTPKMSQAATLSRNEFVIRNAYVMTIKTGNRKQEGYDGLLR